MSNPRYRPRDYTTEPSAFGRAAVIQWRHPNRDWAKDQAVAAWMQHVYAVRINKSLRDRGMSLADYAKETGQSYDKVSKMLRGEVIMRLDDIAQAHRLLDNVMISLPTDPFMYAPSDNIFG